MAIIKQELVPVAGANSYNTAAELRAFALARGVTLSAVDADLEPLLINAMDAMEYLNYKGVTVDDIQSTTWPRVINDVNLLPSNIGKAQLVLALEYHAGNDTMAATDGSILQRKRIEGAIDKTWDTSNTDGRVFVPLAASLLNPYLSTKMTRGSKNGFSIVSAN